MICRLLIITIITFNSSNDFVFNYLLIVFCGVASFIHVTVKPYNKEVLNKLDGIVLLLMNFTAILPFFDSPLVTTTAYLLVILPLISFIALTLIVQRDGLKKIGLYFTSKRESPSHNDTNNNDIPMREFDLVIDNSMRRNATICTV